MGRGAMAYAQQTLHFGSLFSLSERHSMLNPSSIKKRPFKVSPQPVNTLIASAACMAPMMPTSGANTPITAQRVSSNS